MLLSLFMWQGKIIIIVYDFNNKICSNYIGRGNDEYLSHVTKMDNNLNFILRFSLDKQATFYCLEFSRNENFIMAAG